MTGPIQAVASIEALLLRARMPDLPLREGSAFVARVASKGADGKASLVVAGELLTATVPEDVRAGRTLRLTVSEVSPERVLLRVEQQAQQAPLQLPAQAAPPPPPPGRPGIAVEDRPGPRRDARGESAVTLVVETPALGTVRVRVATAPGAVTATVQVPPAALAHARAHVEALRAGLVARTGRAASVQVVPASVDLRA